MIGFRNRTRAVAWLLAMVMVLSLVFSPAMTGTASAAGAGEQLKDLYRHLDDNNVKALNAAQDMTNNLDSSQWDEILEPLMTDTAKRHYSDVGKTEADLRADLEKLLTDLAVIFLGSATDIKQELENAITDNEETLGILLFEPTSGVIPVFDKQDATDFFSDVYQGMIDIIKNDLTIFVGKTNLEIIATISPSFKQAMYEAQANVLVQGMDHLEWLDIATEEVVDGDILVESMDIMYDKIDASGKARIAIYLGAMRTKLTAPAVVDTVSASVYDTEGRLIAGKTMQAYNVGDEIRYELQAAGTNVTNLANWTAWDVSGTNIVSVSEDTKTEAIIFTASNPGTAYIVAYRQDKVDTTNAQDDWLFIFEVNVASPTDAADLTFNVKDEAGNELEGAAVDLAGITLLTDADGQVKFTRTVATYAYEVSKTEYVSEAGDVELVAGGTTVDITLVQKEYTITFEVKNSAGTAIDAANVTFGGVLQQTGTNGQTVFQKTYGTYSYTVAKSGYNTVSNSSYAVTMTATVPVTLIVTSGGGGGGGGGGGTTATEKVTKLISGANGGSISLSEITVTIPAGGMATDANLTITKRNSTSGLVLGSLQKFLTGTYEVTKDTAGALLKAATVSMTFNKNLIDDPDLYKIELCYYDTSTKTWVALADQNLDWDKGVVSGTTTSLGQTYAVIATKLADEGKDGPDKPVQPAVLTDIAGHWAEFNIRLLVDAGIISGYPDGTFKPDRNITRAEFTVLLVKAFDLTPSGGKVFADTVNHWAKEYIATANANGVVAGYNDSQFGPDDFVTREQMAVMTAKAKNLASAEGKVFTDAAQISAWAKSSVDTCSAHGIFSGYPDGSFQPKNNATRAEAATVIVEAMK